MTRRATFTQAEMTRAIRAAKAAGKVAIYTPDGIVFADPSAIPQTAAQTSAAESGGNTCDAAFGVVR